MDTSCKACPENTNCPGSNEIILKEGFWRSDIYSD